ncbi:MAG: hypothetical protein K0R54_435 [Clostridiaceae bacterium]|jgi:hypothetical protein|nr:hypothetical protein [Clostridiaceae bacterium]
MDFKKLAIEDKDIFDKYLVPYKFLNCEYSFTTLYIWKDACDVCYTIYNGSLIIKKKDFQGRNYFMQPLGYKKESLKFIIDTLIDYKKKTNMHYLFKDLEENFIDEIRAIYKNIDNFYIKEDRDNFDYLYDASKLMKLSGKKLHKKKNHYNSFIKSYNYITKNIADKNVGEQVIESAERIYEQHGKSKDLYYELQGIKNIIHNMDLLGLRGIAVYVDNEVAAFTIGEKVSDDMAIIHIEKAFTKYDGVYSFVNRAFIEQCFNNVKIINREQDLGIEGLRKSKMSYYPMQLEKKYIFSF